MNRYYTQFVCSGKAFLLRKLVRTSYRYFVLSFIIATIPIASYSAVKITTKHENYNFTATNLQEVSLALIKLGPKDKDGHSFSAKTAYRFLLNYKLKKSNNLCQIDRINTEVIITYRMPELQNISNLSPELSKYWNEYLNKLSVHEQGHAKIAADAAFALDKAVSALPPSSDCKILIQDIINTTNLINKHSHNINAEYDNQTGHGYTQGVKLAME